MIRAFLVWLQTRLGKGPGPDDQSWSEALLGSLNFWGILEGTHLLLLMLFVGCIMAVDLRLMGVIYRRTPVSVVSRRLLPLTIAGMVLMLVTGGALFFAKPLVYFHNIWFRAKMVLLAAAMVNIAIFHFRIQRRQPEWDTAPSPPLAARASALVSLSIWVLMIVMGRFIAYNWYDCGKPQPDIVNALQQCAASEHGAVRLAAEPGKAGGR
jgi:hypothetical protein